jgi:diguanylate cyclase (GGDEF)-like protein
MRRDSAEADAVAAAAPAVRRPRRPRWRWSTFREGLARRHDAEHLFGLARVGVLSLWLIYCVVSDPSLVDIVRRPAALVAALALVAAAWLLNEASKDPDVSSRRRLAGAVLDQCFVFLTLMVIGDNGAWLLPLSLLVSVANGLHFGRGYGLFAAGLSAAGFVSAVLLRPDVWIHSATLVKAAAAALIAIPAYVALVAERLINASEEYRARARKMARIAMEDPLTRLANRAYFKKSLTKAVDNAKAGELEESFAVMYCDLDNFKLINDTHGHAAGDAVLRKVAEALRKCVRRSDVVARLGGDEFAVYLKGLSDAEIAKRIGRSIVEAVRSIDSVEGTPVQVACSLGITMVAAPVDDAVAVDRVLARADEAMFQAKRAGKNQFYLQWANL